MLKLYALSLDMTIEDIAIEDMTIEDVMIDEMTIEGVTLKERRDRICTNTILEAGGC